MRSKLTYSRKFIEGIEKVFRENKHPVGTKLIDVKHTPGDNSSALIYYDKEGQLLQLGIAVGELMRKEEQL